MVVVDATGEALARQDSGITDDCTQIRKKPIVRLSATRRTRDDGVAHRSALVHTKLSIIRHETDGPNGKRWRFRSKLTSASNLRRTFGERLVNLLRDAHGCFQRAQASFTADDRRLSIAHAIQERLDFGLQRITLLE